MPLRGEQRRRIVTDLVRRLSDLAECKGRSALPDLAVLNESIDDFAPIPTSSSRAVPLPSDGDTSDPLGPSGVHSPSMMRMDRSRQTNCVRAIPSLQTFPIDDHDTARIEIGRGRRAEHADGCAE